MDVINLQQKFSAIDAHWQPKIIGAVNDFHVKLVKIKGEFLFHQHETEDELFLIIKGRMLMRFRDHEVWVGEGECVIVPHGVEHCPVAPEEVHLMLLEPASTVNTGTAESERTVQPEWI